MHQRDRVDPPHALGQRPARLRDRRAAGLQAQQRGDGLQVVLDPVVDLPDRRVLAEQREVAAAQVGDVADEHQRAGRGAPRAQRQRAHAASTAPRARDLHAQRMPPVERGVDPVGDLGGVERVADQRAGRVGERTARRGRWRGPSGGRPRARSGWRRRRGRARRAGSGRRRRAGWCRRRRPTPRAGTCRRRSSGTGRRRCRGRRSPAGWARGASRGSCRARAPPAPRCRAGPGSSPGAPAPPGASAGPPRGRSAARRRPAAAAGSPPRSTRAADDVLGVRGRRGRRPGLRHAQPLGGRRGVECASAFGQRGAPTAGSRRTTCRRAAATPRRRAAGARRRRRGSRVCSASNSLSVDTRPSLPAVLATNGPIQPRARLGARTCRRRKEEPCPVGHASAATARRAARTTASGRTPETVACGVPADPAPDGRSPRRADGRAWPGAAGSERLLEPGGAHLDDGARPGPTRP